MPHPNRPTTAPRRPAAPRRLLLLAAFAGACGGAPLEPAAEALLPPLGATTYRAPPVPTALLPYDAPGAYAVRREIGGPGDAFILYTPETLGEHGERHPILTWGNGTAAIPLFYDGLLRHFASHGMVVIASRSTMTGTGREMLAGVDWLLAQEGTAGSRFYQKLDRAAVGATGHSQGGGGTINAGNDPRVRALAPIEPAPGRIAGVRAPLFLLGGSEDRIVSPAVLIRPFSYVPATAPTVYGVLTGANHFTALGNAEGFRGYLTAWFKHHLMGDAAAGQSFYGPSCGLCSDGAWTVERKNLP